MKLKGGKTNMTIEAVILQVDHFFTFAQETEIPQLGKGGVALM